MDRTAAVPRVPWRLVGAFVALDLGLLCCTGVLASAQHERTTFTVERTARVPRVQTAAVTVEAAAPDAASRAAADVPPTSARTADGSPAPLTPTDPSLGVGELYTGECVNPSGPTVETAQSVIDRPCVADMEYGPSRWLAAHDTFAGDAWKRLTDGGEFTFEGRRYRITDRVTIPRSIGASTRAPADVIVVGDLTLQTCDGPDLVFLHAVVEPAP